MLDFPSAHSFRVGRVGQSNDEIYYDYMKSYSPYDNVRYPDYRWLE